jgi:hypothetical protein
MTWAFAPLLFFDLKFPDTITGASADHAAKFTQTVGDALGFGRCVVRVNLIQRPSEAIALGGLVFVGADQLPLVETSQAVDANQCAQNGHHIQPGQPASNSAFGSSSPRWHRGILHLAGVMWLEYEFHSNRIYQCQKVLTGRALISPNSRARGRW